VSVSCIALVGSLEASVVVVGAWKIPTFPTVEVRVEVRPNPCVDPNDWMKSIWMSGFAGSDWFPAM